MTQFAKKIFDCVARIPKGQTTTYKAIAIEVGTNPRIVGNILHHNPDPQKYPCHRVIRSDGSLADGFAFGGKEKQRALLQSEGVKI